MDRLIVRWLTGYLIGLDDWLNGEWWFDSRVVSWINGWVDGWMEKVVILLFCRDFVCHADVNLIRSIIVVYNVSIY